MISGLTQVSLPSDLITLDCIIVPLKIYDYPNIEMRSILEQSLETALAPKIPPYYREPWGKHWKWSKYETNHSCPWAKMLLKGNVRPVNYGGQGLNIIKIFRVRFTEQALTSS